VSDGELSNQAKGAFLKEIGDFIGSMVLPKFAETGSNGLQLVEVSSVEHAIEWLRKNG
jgi:hypothetical protein